MFMEELGCGQRTERRCVELVGNGEQVDPLLRGHPEGRLGADRSLSVTVRSLARYDDIALACSQ